MNDNHKIGLALASLTFAMSSFAAPANEAKTKTQKSEHASGECHGANSCKGTGDCGGKGHSCAGKNTCKGQGWTKWTGTEQECKDKGGTFKAG